MYRPYPCLCHFYIFSFNISRFGEDETPTTTIRLPIEALGDADLVRRLMKLPVDRRPFWLLNWQALQAQRDNPTTYEQKENVFVDFNRS